MPARIRFAAAGHDKALSVDVVEDAAAITDAIREAKGHPVRLTTRGPSPRPVYVNPLTVAYWADISGRNSRVSSV